MLRALGTHAGRWPCSHTVQLSRQLSSVPRSKAAPLCPDPRRHYHRAPITPVPAPSSRVRARPQAPRVLSPEKKRQRLVRGPSARLGPGLVMVLLVPGTQPACLLGGLHVWPCQPVCRHLALTQLPHLLVLFARLEDQVPAQATQRFLNTMSGSSGFETLISTG